jgi:hypothetical protein
MESLFERLLREKIGLISDMRTQATLSRGLTFEEYQYNLGYLEALGHVLAACEEIQSEMRKD